MESWPFTRAGVVALMNGEAYRIFGLPTGSAHDLASRSSTLLKDHPDVVRVLLRERST